MSLRPITTAAAVAARLHESVGHSEFGRRSTLPGGQSVTLVSSAKFSPIVPASDTSSGHDPKMSPVSFASRKVDTGHISVGMGRTSPDLQGRVTPTLTAKGAIGDFLSAVGSVFRDAAGGGFGGDPFDPEFQRPDTNTNNGGRRSPANGNPEFDGREISNAGDVDHDRDKDATKLTRNVTVASKRNVTTAYKNIWSTTETE